MDSAGDSAPPSPAACLPRYSAETWPPDGVEDGGAEGLASEAGPAPASMVAAWGDLPLVLMMLSAPLPPELSPVPIWICWEGGASALASNIFLAPFPRRFVAVAAIGSDTGGSIMA